MTVGILIALKEISLEFLSTHASLSKEHLNQTGFRVQEKKKKPSSIL